MIDDERTLEIYGYTSDELKPKSHKHIVAVCEECGQYRDMQKRGYKEHGLCRGCVVSATMMGHSVSDKVRAAISASLTDVSLSSEHRDAISDAKKGIHLSPEHIAAIKNSDANKAQIETPNEMSTTPTDIDDDVLDGYSQFDMGTLGLCYTEKRYC